MKECLKVVYYYFFSQTSHFIRIKTRFIIRFLFIETISHNVVPTERRLISKTLILGMLIQFHDLFLYLSALMLIAWAHDLSKSRLLKWKLRKWIFCPFFCVLEPTLMEYSFLGKRSNGAKFDTREPNKDTSWTDEQYAYLYSYLRKLLIKTNFSSSSHPQNMFLFFSCTSLAYNIVARRINMYNMLYWSSFWIVNVIS